MIYPKGYFLRFGGDKELIGILHHHQIGFDLPCLSENDYLQRAADSIVEHAE